MFDLTVGKDTFSKAVSDVNSSFSVHPDLCRSCQRWKAGPDDRYCAWCSAPLIVPEIDCRELLFTATQSRCERVLTLTNDGTNKLFATLEFSGADAAVSRFSMSPAFPDNLYEVPAGGHLAITFGFDCEGISPAVDYSVVLKIETNAPDESLTASLKVERPPIALILPSASDRTLFVYGDSCVLPIRIRNMGDAVLTVSAFRVEEPRLSAASQPCAIDILRSGEATLEITINIEKLPAGDYIARGTIEFRNHASAIFTRQIRVLRPARLRIQPGAVFSDLYPIGRRDRQELELQNIGDEPLDIERISSNKMWLDHLCRNAHVNPRSHVFVDIFLDGKGLSVGQHSAELEIVSNAFGGTVKVPIQAHVHDLQVLTDPIGVDFGTSLSCVATVRDGDPVLVNINPHKGPETVEGYGLPSVVFFEENMFPIVGKEAKDRAEIDPSACVQSVKRLLGGNSNLHIRGKEFTPTEIATEIFRTLLGAVERAVVDRGSPRHAILTIPADISDQQTYQVLAAARAAGLRIDTGHSQEYVLDEPSAAALYYLWKSRKHADKLRESERIFIYDFGAGTLDCSLVLIKQEANGTTIEVLATTGDRRLGGNDVDTAIGQYVASRLHDSNGFDGTPILYSNADLRLIKGGELTRVIRSRARFRDLAEQMKIELSSSDETKADYPTSPNELSEVTLTSQDLGKIMQPFLQRSEAIIDACCAQARTVAASVHTVLHSGRGSAIKVLRESVNARFPSAVDRSEFIEAKQCVALGAAWWAHIKNLPGIDIQFRGLSPKLPHSIGYRDVENFASVFRPIFEAGQCYPAERQITFLSHASRKFELDIVEKCFAQDRDFRSRGVVRIPACETNQNYNCVFRLTPQRTLEVVVAGRTIEIDPYQDESNSES
jgi:molecular chaperone DnaK (HSP70)